MTSQEKFCLKWNDFQHSIVSSFQGLREETDFSDVTLVCEDNQQIQSHRIILTACSPFFSRVLKQNKHSHPTIYMRGLKAKDLVAIVDFIYHGEANVYHEDLDGFLALAEELQLKGLTGSETEVKERDDNCDQKYATQEVKENQSRIRNFKDFADTGEAEDKSENSSIVQVNPAKVLVTPHSDLENIKAQINSMMEKVLDGNKRWRCTVCGKESKDRQDMSRHIETHMEGISYPCNQCGKVSRSSNALKTHLSTFHRK